MPKKILFIEDDVLIGKMYKTALENHGYQIDLVPTSEEGQKKLNEQTAYDLMLLDLYLPGNSGFNLLKELKKEGSTFKNIPVYILTNAASPDFIADGLALGAQGYFIKVSTTPSQLTSTIDEFFKNRPA